MTIRLADMARRLELSTATVSLALKGDPRVAKGTREKVEALAAELKYVPDPGLRRLAETRWRGRDKTSDYGIALLRWSPNDYQGIHREIFPHVKREVEKLGYGFEGITVEEQGGPGRLRKVLNARGVQGLICFAARSVAAWRTEYLEGFSAIQIQAGMEAGDSGMPVVRSDAFQTILEAGERILSVGAKKGAVLLFTQDPPSATDLRSHAGALYVLDKWRRCGLRTQPLHTIRPRKSESPWSEGRDWLLTLRNTHVVIPNEGILSWTDPGELAERNLELLALEKPEGAPVPGFVSPLHLQVKLAIGHLDAAIRSGTRVPSRGPAISIVVPRLFEPEDVHP